MYKIEDQYSALIRWTWEHKKQTSVKKEKMFNHSLLFLNGGEIENVVHHIEPKKSSGNPV